MGKISIKQMNETLANYSENFPKTDTEKENLFEMCLILSNYIRRGLIRFDTEEEENDLAFYFAEEIYAQVVSGRKVKYWVSYMQAKGPPNPMHFLPPKTHTAKRTAAGGPFCVLFL